MQEKIDLKARHNARKLAIQALYQWSMTNDDLHTIEAQFLAANSNRRIEYDYLHELLFAVPSQLTHIDESFSPYLTRDISDIDLVELTVLRLACYELTARLDIPYQVIINEALELTKQFGSPEGFKFINGVLDKTAKQLRPNG